MKSITGTVGTLASRSDDRSLLRYLAGVRWGVLLAAIVLSIIGLATIVLPFT